MHLCFSFADKRYYFSAVGSRMVLFLAEILWTLISFSRSSGDLLEDDCGTAEAVPSLCGESAGYKLPQGSADCALRYSALRCLRLKRIGNAAY
jgi:hypothetical protein